MMAQGLFFNHRLNIDKIKCRFQNNTTYFTDKQDDMIPPTFQSVISLGWTFYLSIAESNEFKRGNKYK